MKIKSIINKFYGFSVKKHLIIIFCVALFVRICVSFVAYKTNAQDKWSDDLLYLDYTKTLINEGINFSLFVESVYIEWYDYIGPGIGILNYPIVCLFPNNCLMIFVFVSVIGSFIPIMIFLISHKLFNKSIALLSAYWSVFYILYLKFIPTMGKETWMSLFLLINVYFVFLLTDNNRDRKIVKQILVYFTSAIVMAFSILFDERFFVFILVFPILLLFYNKPFFNGFKIALVYSILVLLFLLPWNIRNYQRYDKVVIISKRTEHLTDRVLGYKNQDSGLMDDICALYGRYYIHDYQIDSVISGKKTVTDGGSEISEEMKLAMKNGYLPHPFKWYEAIWSRLKEFWRPLDLSNEYQKTGYCFNGKWSFRHNASTFLSYGILLPFFILGLFKLFKQEKKIFTILFLTIVVYCIIHVATICFTTWRYRVPIDSLIMIIAFYYLSSLFKKGSLICKEQ